MSEGIKIKTAKKIKASNLLNIILVLCLITVCVFGYLYYKQQSVVDVVKKVAPASNMPGKPQYLYTIYGPPNERFMYPSFTYVDGNRIYVADTMNKRVAVFDYNGKYVSKFDSMGKTKMQSPCSITSDVNNLYVADYRLGKIGIYSKDGAFQGYFAEKHLGSPQNIVFKNNKMYVFDMKFQCVKVFDPSGNIQLKFGKAGGGAAEFRFANGINADDQGNIYVADSDNYRIQVFTPEGKPKAVWRSERKDNAEGYTIPRTISFDKGGFAWTAQLLAGAVSVSDKSGKRLAMFVDGENTDDTMTMPTATWVDANNRLYVTTLGGHRVLVYQIP